MAGGEDKPESRADDAVDVTLIRWMLSKTPAERLQILQRHVQAVLKIRAANRCAHRDSYWTSADDTIPSR